MSKEMQITPEELEKAYQKLLQDTETAGYHLNPDLEFTKALIESLLINEARYGYQACPCRLASGKKEEDLDIICPCDYRDSDLTEYAACYCALYVSDGIHRGEAKAKPIPERRPGREERLKKLTANSNNGEIKNPAYPVWRCKVCGYLSARNEPPEVCPICKAKVERFERFL
jgi:ferredoxin-thioredoxin reductase catalytic subunit